MITILDRTPIKISILTFLSWASSIKITEYYGKSALDYNSFSNIPSVIN